MLDGRELGALARPATGASEMHDASGALHTSSPAVMDQEEREQAKVIRDYFEGKWIKKITACSLSLNREPHREPLADGVAGRSCCGFPGHESAGVRSAVCSCLQATVAVSRHQSSVTPSRARDLSLSAQVSAICRQDGRMQRRTDGVPMPGGWWLMADRSGQNRIIGLQHVMRWSEPEQATLSPKSKTSRAGRTRMMRPSGASLWTTCAGCRDRPGVLLASLARRAFRARDDGG